MARRHNDLLQAPILAVCRVVSQRSRAVQSGHDCCPDSVLFHPSVSQVPMLSSNYRGASRDRRDIPQGGRSSRGRVSLLDIRSPGLLSRRVSTIFNGGQTADRGLPLSDQPPACASRNPRRTLLYLHGASRVPDTAGARRIPGNAAETKTCVLIQSSPRRRRSDATSTGCTVSAHCWNALPKFDSTGEGVRRPTSAPAG